LNFHDHYQQVIPRRRIKKRARQYSLSTSFFVGFGVTTLFTPLVAAVITKSSANNWSFPATISYLATTTIETTTTATPSQVPPLSSEGVPSLGYELLVWVANLVVTLVFVAIWYKIYRQFCHCTGHTVRTFDRTRFVGMIVMLVLFGTYVVIYGDPRSGWGLLLGQGLLSFCHFGNHTDCM
jgi:hypothetical protein